MSLVDVNQQVGKQAEEALRQQHGNESTLFIQCDVSNKTQLEGNYILVVVLIIYHSGGDI